MIDQLSAICPWPGNLSGDESNKRDDAHLSDWETYLDCTFLGPRLELGSKLKIGCDDFAEGYLSIGGHGSPSIESGNGEHDGFNCECG